MAGSPALLERARSAAFRRYGTATVWGRLALRVRWLQQRPVLVYQMGKVGSSAVVASLEAAGLGPVAHVHRLAGSALAAEAAGRRSQWHQMPRAWHIWQAQEVARRLARGDGPWTVVTLVREPVARNLSSFLQIAELELGIPLDPFLVRGAEPEVAIELTSLFLERFPQHDLPLTWFDDELHAALGVDVFGRPFSTDRGWDIHETDRARVLVIRLDDLTARFTSAIESLVGVPGVPLLRANVGEDKRYGPLYRHWLDHLSLPPDYLDRLYNSRYARHFWTEAERAGFRKQWVVAAR